MKKKSFHESCLLNIHSNQCLNAMHKHKDGLINVLKQLIPILMQETVVIRIQNATFLQSIKLVFSSHQHRRA